MPFEAGPRVTKPNSLLVRDRQLALHLLGHQACLALLLQLQLGDGGTMHFVGAVG